MKLQSSYFKDISYFSNDFCNLVKGRKLCFTNFSSFLSLLGKLSESDRARASSPNSVKLTPLTNTKKVMALVDYDADSDEEEADDESESSPKKQKPNAASVSGKQTGNSSNDNDHPKATRSSGSDEAIFKTFETKSEKEEAASIVVETTGSESSEELKTGNGKAEDSEAATSDKIVAAPKAEAKESEQQEVPDSNEVENHENKSGKNTFVMVDYLPIYYLLIVDYLQSSQRIIIET